jgi:hypothetical protein
MPKYSLARRRLAAIIAGACLVLAGWGASLPASAQVSIDLSPTPELSNHTYLPLTLRDLFTPPPETPVPNGGFESGDSGQWQVHSQAGATIVTNSSAFPAHSGQWYARLGGVNFESAYLAQTVTVPYFAHSLRYWMRIESPEACGRYFDPGTVTFGGTQLEKYDLCFQWPNPGWVRRSFDISPYAGQTVELRFAVTTDYANPGSLLIDDVAFEP